MTSLCVWLSLPTVWGSWNTPSPTSNNAWLKALQTETPALQKLKALRRNLDPAHLQDFQEALATEATKRARCFVAGVKKYQQFPLHRSMSGMPVIWQRGETKVRDYNPASLDAPVVFVVPSLINRFDILDLDVDHSFLRWLAAQGFRPLVMDWGAPSESEKDFAITDYVMQRLVPALESVVTATHAPVHMMGYCMGGLLALAVAALQPRLVRSLTCMATPWDFHQPHPAIGAEFLELTERLEPQLAKYQTLSVDTIQALFAVLQPLKVTQKFTAFVQTAPDSLEARRFVMLEDWLNDGVALTANVARECLGAWYGRNETAKGGWRVAGQTINPRHIVAPSYILVPGKDQIVPPESALPLAKALPHATLHHPLMGHIGLMASHKAPNHVWAPLAQWLRQIG